ncbi:hypothetical protein Tco_0868059 [Tanacetum coccineum]
MSPAYLPQVTKLPQAFQMMAHQEPNWNMDTGASSHLAKNTVKDYQTHRLLLRCDSTGDLYLVTLQTSITTPFAFLNLSSTTWHMRL